MQIEYKDIKLAYYAMPICNLSFAKIIQLSVTANFFCKKMRIEILLLRSALCVPYRNACIPYPILWGHYI